MSWIYVMFDLPTNSKVERKEATKFRSYLLDRGFQMAQYSIYLRFTKSREVANTHISRVKSAWPGKGRLHIITITDQQYANAHIIVGENREYRTKKPDLISFF